MAKFAFLGGLRVGTGLVVAKLADGSWSAPCAVGSFGVSFGAALGAEITDMITPVDSRAIEEFCNANTSKVSMGGEASLAFGPVGRTASGDAFFASDASVAGATSYSQSRGFYGGVTLDGAYLKVRDDVNLRFYGGGVTAASLLRGQTRQPNAAQPLYEQLHEFYTMLDQRQRSLNASDLRKLQDSRGQSVRAPPHDANPWGAFEAQPPRVERPPPMQQAYQPPMQQAPAYVPQPTTDSMFFSTPLFAAAPPGTKPRNANSGVVEV